MINVLIKEVYFSFSGVASHPRLSISGNGDLKCRLNCFEWSDGRLGCPHKRASIVQKSRKTGEFIWYSDYIAEGIEMGQSNKAESYGLHDLKKAYNQFKNAKKLNDERCLSLFLEIIHAYNDEYHRNPWVNKKIPTPDYLLFILCVLEAQKMGKDKLPASIRVELYREIGMFEKCFEFSPADGLDNDEREIIAEVLLHAVRGDKKPFIIERCKYYKSKNRFIKRTPCPVADC